MKFALGLFHFNPHWNLDDRSAHRHCTEALLPLLRTLQLHSSWHVTIEISGAGLEFLHQFYPAYLKTLRSMVEAGQVELISSLYTPNAWIAFPFVDLLRSIEANQKCLSNLGFPWSRIFFAQEAFFGQGVAQLVDYFDIAICKDDYLSHYYDLDFSNPCHSCDGMTVVVASNHLVSNYRNGTTNSPMLRKSLIYAKGIYGIYARRARSMTLAAFPRRGGGKVAQNGFGIIVVMAITLAQSANRIIWNYATMIRIGRAFALVCLSHIHLKAIRCDLCGSS